MPWGERGWRPSSSGDGRIENRHVHRVDQRSCIGIKDTDPYQVAERRFCTHLCQVAEEGRLLSGTPEGCVGFRLAAIAKTSISRCPLRVKQWNKEW